MKLPTVEAALALMLEAVRPLPPQDTPLAQADGRWLAEDVTATRDQPPFDASAMDGYAVRVQDLTAGAETRLAVVGTAFAGRPFSGIVGPGQAVRIFTGAHVPAWADTVAVQEDAERAGDSVAFPR